MGTATLTVTGIGNYTGTQDKDFTISAVPLYVVAQAQTQENTTLVGTAVLARDAFGNLLFEITGGEHAGKFEFKNGNELHFTEAETPAEVPNPFVFYYVQIKATDDGDTVGHTMMIQVEVISGTPPFTVFQFK